MYIHMQMYNAHLPTNLPDYWVPDLQTAVVKTAIGRLQNLFGVVAP